jgi:hypothetical protein
MTTHLANEPDVAAALRDACRSVSVAKLTEFGHQCCRLGALVAERLADCGTVADELYSIAITNDLVDIHGDDRIQHMIADGFESGVQS